MITKRDVSTSMICLEPELQIPRPRKPNTLKLVCFRNGLLSLGCDVLRMSLYFIFKILLVLNQAVPYHLAEESQLRQPDTPPDNPCHCKVTNFCPVLFSHFWKKYKIYFRMKIYFRFEALEFQWHFVFRPSKVRKLVRTNQFQVKSTKMGTRRKFVTLQ